MRFLTLVLLITSLSWGAQAMAETEDKNIEKVLNRLHEAAAEADFEGYFGLFHPDAVFIGTDASERWDLGAFKAYTKPHFAAGKGWTYKPKTRHIQVAGKVAWFDEILDSASYGVCRDTGVLLKEGQQWQIVQYHLTIPIPNALADQVVSLIKKDSSLPSKK